MLESLIEEAISKKGEIQDNIREYESRDFNIDKYWFDRTIPVNEPCVIGAGDGSFNKKRFISFFLYAVDAESLVYTPNSDVPLSSTDFSSIGTLAHNLGIDDHLSNFMNIFELKSTINTLKNKDLKYYLFDGSIYGDLAWLFSYSSNLKRSDMKNLIDNFYTRLKENLFNYKLASKTLLDEDFNDFSNEEYLFLENLEKALLLKELLSDKKRLVAISKTSSDMNLLDRGVPDIALFNFFSKGEGYSEIKHINLGSIHKDFPIYNEFFQSLEFTVFYARFEPYKSVLKFELPYHASYDECLQVLGDLKRDCVDGYPYLLYRAHHDVVISNKDMDSISSIVDVVERQGREML